MVPTNLNFFIITISKLLLAAYETPCQRAISTKRTSKSSHLWLQLDKSSKKITQIFKTVHPHKSATLLNFVYKAVTQYLVHYPEVKTVPA